MGRLTSFQRLALTTTATTYFLIFVGGLVRASGAGLGCPDWPRCFGTWLPPLSAADLPPQFAFEQFNATLMWTEYLNRVLGVLVGFLILATLILAWRRHRRTVAIFWPTLAAFLLVGVQGWLGGVVVEHELAPWIVTVHMLLALVIVSLLLYATVYSLLHPRTAQISISRRLLVGSTAALIAMSLLQVALGTQVREGVDIALATGVARDSVLAQVGRMDLWHRELGLVTFAITVAVGVLVWARHRGDRLLCHTATLMGALTLGQLLLGVAMAYVSLTPPAQVAHLTTASLVLGCQTVLLLLARWLPSEAAGAEDVVTNSA